MFSTSKSSFLLEDISTIPPEVKQTILSSCVLFSNTADRLINNDTKDYLVIYSTGMATSTAVGIVSSVGDTSTLYPTFITLANLKHFLVIQMIDSQGALEYLQSLVSLIE